MPFNGLNLGWCWVSPFEKVRNILGISATQPNLQRRCDRPELPLSGCTEALFKALQSKAYTSCHATHRVHVNLNIS
jgi:hypothetical protein